MLFTLQKSIPGHARVLHLLFLLIDIFQYLVLHTSFLLVLLAVKCLHWLRKRVFASLYGIWPMYTL